MKIDEIEDIYKEYNICKCIFVCKEESYAHYLQILLERDFSVTTIDECSLFAHNNRSILLKENINILENKILIDLILNLNISVVIYIDTINKIPQLNHIFSIIL
jgi:hypothetical protein